MAKTSKKDNGYNRRRWALGMAAVALILAYWAGSRAIHTGSLQQYAITAILIFIAIIEIGVAVRKQAAEPKNGKQPKDRT